MEEENQLNSYSLEALLKLDRDTLESKAAFLPAELCFAVTSALQPAAIADWPEKTIALFKGFKKMGQWEMAAKGLTLPQVQILLRYFGLEAKSFPLAPFFVGLTPSVFSLLMQCIEPPILASLRGECIEEPLQHQLTLLCHELAGQQELLFKEVEEFKSAVCSLQPIELLEEDVAIHLAKINYLAQRYQQAYTMASNGLDLAWNSERADLIEKLMALKEQLFRFLKFEVGAPSLGEKAATGLYFFFEKQITLIFEKLQDSDPAMEALTALNIWYLADYSEVGLLPQSPLKELVNLQEKITDETLKQERIAQLHLAARQKLQQAGLNVVADFKKELICSKKILKNYLLKSFEKELK